MEKKKQIDNGAELVRSFQTSVKRASARAFVFGVEFS